MTDTSDRLNTVIEAVEDKLKDYFNQRNDMQDLSQWRIKQITLSDKSRSITFENNDATHHRLSLSDVPKDLTVDEKLAFKQAITTFCSDYGCQAYTPQVTSLEKQTMGAVVEGDPHAWNKFTERYSPTFLRGARALPNQNRYLVDESDRVSEALMSVFCQAREGKLSPDSRITFVVPRTIYRDAYRDKRLNESDSDQISDRPAAEYDGMPEVLQEQLQETLEIAKNKMTPRQQELFAVISDPKLEKRPTLVQMGKSLGFSHEIARRHLQKITEAIQETAHQLEYDELAGYIDHLVRANTQKRSAKPR